MPDTKFTAYLPKEIQAGDKIRIKGKITDDAEQFSINFVNDVCLNPPDPEKPQNITYHFKWLPMKGIIIQDHKEDGEWINYQDMPYSALDGPTFALEFAFQNSLIYVYLVEGEGRNLITKYEPVFELSDIRSIQVWGNVDKINELSFLYD